MFKMYSITIWLTSIMKWLQQNVQWTSFISYRYKTKGSFFLVIRIHRLHWAHVYIHTVVLVIHCVRHILSLTRKSLPFDHLHSIPPPPPSVTKIWSRLCFLKYNWPTTLLLILSGTQHSCSIFLHITKWSP